MRDTAPDSALDTALSGARLVEEAAGLLTFGEAPDQMVAHAFERLGELVSFDMAAVLLRDGDQLRVAHALGPITPPGLVGTRIPIKGNLRLQNALKTKSKPTSFEEDDPGEDTLQTVRFYVPAIGAISLLGAWLVTRIPGRAWLAALTSAAVVTAMFGLGAWSFHAMIASRLG